MAALASLRTLGLVGAMELALMKPTARLINTSRRPIVVEADLIRALKDKTIAGAAIDVFDQEPLPLEHRFRRLPDLLATPHIGYVSRGLYERFYRDTVENMDVGSTAKQRADGRCGPGMLAREARRYLAAGHGKIEIDHP